MNLHQALSKYSLRPGRDFRRSKFSKGCPEFKSLWGGGAIPVAWNMLEEWCQDRRLHKERSQPQGTILDLCPTKIFFCSSVTKHDTRPRPKPNLFILVKRLQGQRP
jgi:hypothetical protein